MENRLDAQPLLTRRCRQEQGVPRCQIPSKGEGLADEAGVPALDERLRGVFAVRSDAQVAQPVLFADGDHVHHRDHCGELRYGHADAAKMVHIGNALSILQSPEKIQRKKLLPAHAEGVAADEDQVRGYGAGDPGLHGAAEGANHHIHGEPHGHGCGEGGDGGGDTVPGPDQHIQRQPHGRAEYRDEDQAEQPVQHTQQPGQDQRRGENEAGGGDVAREHGVLLERHQRQDRADCKDPQANERPYAG